MPSNLAFIPSSPIPILPLLCTSLGNSNLFPTSVLSCIYALLFFDSIAFLLVTAPNPYTPFSFPSIGLIIVLPIATILALFTSLCFMLPSRPPSPVRSPAHPTFPHCNSLKPDHCPLLLSH
ncbi:hypothetical protein CC78DRAFT_536316 [Lojkania enalia]|uniref:Uncharacterized protein n=1 Tax=Lojkania enalia TaxID=147567 RepID=A0A9P4K347_9PLEO|nr:hypothetical protein CC78DRAFT_536316 [Didymosphaeria enalia]